MNVYFAYWVPITGLQAGINLSKAGMDRLSDYIQQKITDVITGLCHDMITIC